MKLVIFEMSSSDRMVAINPESVSRVDQNADPNKPLTAVYTPDGSILVKGLFQDVIAALQSGHNPAHP